MGGPKRLLHSRRDTPAQGKAPGKKRRLFFSSLLTIPLLTACATSAHALPRRPELTERRFEGKAACDVDYRSALEKGERVRRIACTKARTYVLTDRSMLVFSSTEEESVEDGVRLKLAYTRTDMSDIYKRGLVSWAQSDDTAYFLTKDGQLSPISAGNLGKTIQTYQLPFDVSKAKMVHRSGMLFIAPLSGNLLVMTFEGTVRFRILPVPDIEGGFFERRDKLFFGKRGSNETEIRIKGKGVDGVSAIPR